MNKTHKYSMNNVCEELLIYSDTFLELKKRLGLGSVLDEQGFNQIKELVEQIRKRYGRINLNTINQYWTMKKLRRADIFNEKD